MDIAIQMRSIELMLKFLKHVLQVVLKEFEHQFNAAQIP